MVRLWNKVEVEPLDHRDSSVNPAEGAPMKGFLSRALPIDEKGVRDAQLRR